jgi:hypothetical protein
MSPESTFEGLEIEGKQFPFKRITLSHQAKIIHKLKPSYIEAIFLWLFPWKRNKRMWIRVRSLAFEKGWKWKVFRIIPKELRCSHIPISIAGGTQADFFKRVEVEVKGHDKPLISLDTSVTPSSSPS